MGLSEWNKEIEEKYGVFAQQIVHCHNVYIFQMKRAFKLDTMKPRKKADVSNLVLLFRKEMLQSIRALICDSKKKNKNGYRK